MIRRASHAAYLITPLPPCFRHAPAAVAVIIFEDISPPLMLPC